VSALTDVTAVDGVTLVTMQEGENRFNLPFVTALEQILLTASNEGRPVVLTGAGKFFSNGLDLDWMGSAGADGSHAAMGRLHRVLARLLAFPGATLAALNGHAFGAGASSSGDDELVPTALARGGKLACKDGPTVGAIKQSLYRSKLAALAKD